MKTCSQCRTSKPEEAFYRDKGQTSGRYPSCKTCNAAYKKKYADKNKPYYKEKSRLFLKTPKGVYGMYKGAAKHRKLEFAITLEQFMQFWQSKCYYCNDTIERAGLDRIDNERGYTLDNIISCCAICNRMKYTHSQDVFVMQCLKIAAKHGYIKLDDLLPPYKKDK